MVSEGERPPSFALPALVDGAVEEVSLDSHLGETLVIAFYPADFNPCCSWGTTDLDGLDRLGEETGIPVLAISGDSVYSHRAFAAEYDLSVPLLADVDGAVSREYGVEAGDDGHGNDRAVFVVGPEETVTFAWRTSDLGEFPPVEAVREALTEARRHGADARLADEIPGGPRTEATAGPDTDYSGADIDDAELARIAAEIEAQSADRPGSGPSEDRERAGGADAGTGGDGTVESEGALTEGGQESEDTEDNEGTGDIFGGGDHGVPDSL